MTIDVDAYADEHGVDLYVLEPRLMYDPCIIDVIVLDAEQVMFDYELEEDPSWLS